MTPVRGPNRAVLRGRELGRSVALYQRAFGFAEVAREMGKVAFLRSPLSANHHDLGMLALGDVAEPPAANATGLYHLVWEVGWIADLAAARRTLEQMGALVGLSDQGATKSLYGEDQDGNEFEVRRMLPRNRCGDFEQVAAIRPLDLEREIAPDSQGGS